MAFINNAARLLLSAKCCFMSPSRGIIYSSKKGVSRDWLVWLQQPLDLTPAGLIRYLKKKQWELLCMEHQFIPERHEMLGPDLATAHFVVARNGAIKFEGFDRWIKKNADGKYHLPAMSDMNLRLEAVDMSSTNMMYKSFDNFVDLDLKYLNVSHCQHIDDWCLDRFVQFRHSLVCLDISGCPNITERGLSALPKLHNLKRLRMYDMPNLRHAKLAAILLEEVLPQCVIEGADYTDVDTTPTDTELTPAFLKRYQEVALSRDRDIEMMIERDGLNEILRKTDGSDKQIDNLKNT